MKKNKITSTRLLQVIAAINGFVQLILFVGTFVYIIYVSNLPLGQHTAAITLWLIAIAPVSIVLNAIAQHQTHLEKQAEYDANHKTISIAIAPIHSYMIRSLFAWIIYITGILTIVLTTISSITIITQLTTLLFKNAILAVLFMMLPVISFMLIGILSTLLFIKIPEPLLDFYLYSNESIQRIAYEEAKNPLAWQNLKSNINMLIRVSLMLSLYMSVLISVKLIPAGLESLRFTEFWSIVLMFQIEALIIYGAYRLFKLLNSE